jgi:carbonic anhydrase/acetyltransferase-like protein (isoleucine patch superfamily)
MDLLRIGDKSIIGQESVISGHTLETQVIEHIRTDIGSEAWVGARTTLLPGSSMSTNSQVDHLSLVLKGERIERANCWQGIPAAPYARLEIPNLKILEKIISMKHSDALLSLTRSLTRGKGVSKTFSKNRVSRHEMFKKNLSAGL